MPETLPPSPLPSYSVVDALADLSLRPFFAFLLFLRRYSGVLYEYVHNGTLSLVSHFFLLVLILANLLAPHCTHLLYVLLFFCVVGRRVIAQVAWNKNGNWLASCSRDQTIKLYDIRTMKTDMGTFKVLYIWYTDKSWALDKSRAISPSRTICPL